MIETGTYFYEGQRRRRRQRIYFKLISVSVFFFALILGGGWLIFRSSFFNVEKITVLGNKDIKKEEVIGLVKNFILQGSFLRNFLGFENFLAWPKEVGHESLASLPTLGSLQVKKNYGERSIILTVTEREPFGVLCLKKNLPSECFWFDREGVIFKRFFEVEGNLIKSLNDYYQENLRLGSKILPEGFIPNLISIFEVINQSSLSIKEISLKNLGLQEVEVDTYDGPKIYFSLRFPAENTLAVIQSLLEKTGFKKLDYLDLRVENRAYYR
ncbi:MAG: hypothetical protein HYT13_02260 [Candidatus Liptonbacteria bacterium]|nr:hypothetical protein [Candidatus Liptonbacteria bacterium]